MSAHKTSVVCMDKYPNVHTAIGLMFERQKLLENIVIRMRPMHMRQIENEFKKLNKDKKSFPNNEYNEWLKKKYPHAEEVGNYYESEFEIFINPIDDQNVFLKEKYNIQNADKFLDDIWDNNYGCEFFEIYK